MLTIADAKRGDIGSTMAAYADAWLREGSPLAADWVTLSPYLGFGSLDPALNLAAVSALTWTIAGLTVLVLAYADIFGTRISVSISSSASTEVRKLS